MYKLHIAITFIFSILTSLIYGQDKLILQSKINPSKTKSILLDRPLTIKTKKKEFYTQIVNHTDTTISIVEVVSANRDSSVFYKQYAGKKDTTIIWHLTKKDTISIPTDEIVYIRRELLKNDKWVEPFAWFAIGAGLGFVILPITAIDEGFQGVKDFAVFEAILIAIVAPPIFLGTRNKKYDFINNWTLKNHELKQ